MKRCNRCGETDIFLFYKDKSKKDGLTTLCKVCCRKTRRKWYLANREKVIKATATYTEKRGREWRNRVNRKSYLKCRNKRKVYYRNQRKRNEVYGICPICEKFTRLVYDHNHASGMFRNWICQSCNMVLGHAYESGRTLSNAIKYLQ